MDIHKISIIGAGQVGVSLLMAIRKKYPHAKISIQDTKKATVCDMHGQIALDPNAALEHDVWAALDRAAISKDNIDFSWDAPEAVSGSDLVILATPISEFGKVIETIGPYVSDNTIITDIGSVKEPAIKRIMATIKAKFPQLMERYVPSHILNGNADTGPLSASPKSPEDGTLFEDKPMVMVPGVANGQSFLFLKNFWQSLGTNIFELTAKQHDQILGTTSHFHYASMFAFILIDDIKTGVGRDIGDWIHGKKGMTRIADANTAVYLSIFQDNRDNVLASAKNFKSILSELLTIITVNHEPSVTKVLGDAHAYAKAVRGDRGGDILDPSEYVGKTDLINSAFASLMSVAVTLNVKNIEEKTGEAFAPMANPSAKDGMGPIGIDLAATTHLLGAYKWDLRNKINNYIPKLDSLIGAIDKNDVTAICRFIDEARHTRQEILSGASRPSLDADPSTLHL